MNEQETKIAARIWPQHMTAFRRQWDNDPYAVARTAALNWLGDRYLLAKPCVRRG
jgi:hypothetical protein